MERPASPHAQALSGTANDSQSHICKVSQYQGGAGSRMVTPGMPPNYSFFLFFFTDLSSFFDPSGIAAWLSVSYHVNFYRFGAPHECSPCNLPGPKRRQKWFLATNLPQRKVPTQACADVFS